MRAGSRADDVARCLRCVDGGVAAHEADHGALDRRREAEVIDDVEVEAGGVEAGAGGDEDVRDAGALGGGEGEVIERLAGERRGEALEDVHALGGVGEAAAGVELVRVDGELGGLGGALGGENGVAMLRCRSAAPCAGRAGWTRRVSRACCRRSRRRPGGRRGAGTAVAMRLRKASVTTESPDDQYDSVGCLGVTTERHSIVV